MKGLALLFTAMFLIGISVHATTTNLTKDNSYSNGLKKGNGNSFIFTEGGIEFSVFPDGQFDFYAPHFGPDPHVFMNAARMPFSFNSGYDYGPYVQYDDYGAIVQIENIPIYYDYYGRITKAGNINIHYNSYGHVRRVGQLHVYYDRHHRFSHYSGYINSYNRVYVPRPWHHYYVVPAYDYRVVYVQPYRQYYTPVRHHYYRPYANNYRAPIKYTPQPRPYVNSSGRRNAVASNATDSDRYFQEASPRRSTSTASRGSNAMTPNTTATRNINATTTNNSSRNIQSARASANTEGSRRGAETNSTQNTKYSNRSVNTQEVRPIENTTEINTAIRGASRPNTKTRSIANRDRINIPATSEPSRSLDSRSNQNNSAERKLNAAPSRTNNRAESTSRTTNASQQNSRRITTADRQVSSTRSGTTRGREK
ncbi:hypothetical protein ES711_03105 [Gelidibacter salicanalis]|uniref:Uncharacterized protein n=1 Tax=Gelidibacter salicanalis TaxID=291193 RepID=A0A5C7ARE4_9FLAO|nr:hypothetical protein [Gelidibacter salicanalis]TXE10907.1 hypothetical protein ES711_03105 [Gelidibacter salicanalis]